MLSMEDMFWLGATSFHISNPDLSPKGKRNIREPSDLSYNAIFIFAVRKPAFMLSTEAKTVPEIVIAVFYMPKRQSDYTPTF